MTTIRELIEALEEAAADMGDDATVRVAVQPNYPLSARVSALTAGEDDDPTLWLAVSDGEGYDAPRDAWRGDYL